jgi:regulator of PEP synthase PpsR (kinase-PPPase family)
VPDEKKIVWVASDGTGRTALQAIKAALYQFGDMEIDLRVVGELTTENKVSDLVKRVKDESGMIVYTIVSETRRRLLHRLADEESILSVDLFGPLIETMEKFFRKVPLESPGLYYNLNRDYYRMVDAVDFTLKHDDGKSPSDIEKADIILIGPSRVGKTPLAVYLAYTGWKVANIPVIPKTPLPETVDKAGARVFCLVIEPEILKKRRVDRIRKLGDPKVDGYTELSSIIHELSYCRKLAGEGKKWPVIDVSKRTVEDVAKQIAQLADE